MTLKRLIKISIISLIIIGIGFGLMPSKTAWGYEANNGPEQWATLDSEFATCGSGEQQSPIDITTSDVKQNGADIKYDSESTAFKTVDTGHSFEYESEDHENNLTYQWETYYLEQMHFHSPSENKIDGKSFPLEAHLVHKSDSGKTQVVAVFFEVGAENEVIANTAEKTDVEVEIDPYALIPNAKTFQFTGSLTTPPCSEDVTWIVYKNPNTISKEQLEQMQSYNVDNNRPHNQLTSVK